MSWYKIVLGISFVCVLLFDGAACEWGLEAEVVFRPAFCDKECAL